jgi:hypothetical protein
VTIGQRMSTEAMAVVIGVVFGVAASIPTSLLVATVTRRAPGRREEEATSHRHRSQPSVIVLGPGAQQSSPWPLPPQNPALPHVLYGSPARSFHVVGDEETVVDGLWQPRGRRSRGEVT